MILLWTALCFALTSAVYLSWVDRMILLLGSSATDYLSMVAGYLCQAGGVFVMSVFLRGQKDKDVSRVFVPVVVLFMAVSVPALLTDQGAGVICFGLLMNLFCGIIAGFYLWVIGRDVKAAKKGIVFGGAYAGATIWAGVTALIDRRNILQGKAALFLYAAAALVIVLIFQRMNQGRGMPETEDQPSGMTEGSFAGGLVKKKWTREDLLLACGVAVLLSAVKNLGFGFPSADIEAGLIPELSRIPYAIGLLLAGLLNDRSRRQGMICTVMALILPFLMLGLTGEPVPGMVFWGLDYLFYGFFSVFRVVLFLDIADLTGNATLAPAGLLMGRIGDAAGTCIMLLLSQHKTALVAVTAVLFFPTVLFFLRLYKKLYEQKAAPVRSEQEVFEAFCLQHDLSSRERGVLHMVISDKTNGEIAEALFITESTVKYHVRNILQKTGCKNRSELLKKYKLALYPQIADIS